MRNMPAQPMSGSELSYHYRSKLKNKGANELVGVTQYNGELFYDTGLSLINCHERRRCICECNVDASCTWRAAGKKNGENPLDV